MGDKKHFYRTRRHTTGTTTANIPEVEHSEIPAPGGHPFEVEQIGKYGMMTTEKESLTVISDNNSLSI